MSRRPQHGMTLIELMVVVAIIGILVGIAVYMYTKTTKKAKAESEVNAMFAEFATRQRDYHAENGEFLTIGTDDSDISNYHPTPVPDIDKGTVISPPDEWRDLKLRPNKTSLYCSYITIAGPGGDDTNIGARAGLFGMTTAPATDWFYVIAECDLDGNSGVNSLYFTRSDAEGIAKQNEGR